MWKQSLKPILATTPPYSISKWPLTTILENLSEHIANHSTRAKFTKSIWQTSKLDCLWPIFQVLRLRELQDSSILQRLSLLVLFQFFCSTRHIAKCEVSLKPTKLLPKRYKLRMPFGIVAHLSVSAPIIGSAKANQRESTWNLQRGILELHRYFRGSNSPLHYMSDLGSAINQ